MSYLLRTIGPRAALAALRLRVAGEYRPRDEYAFDPDDLPTRRIERAELRRIMRKVSP